MALRPIMADAAMKSGATKSSWVSTLKRLKMISKIPFKPLCSDFVLSKSILCPIPTYRYSTHFPKGARFLLFDGYGFGEVAGLVDVVAKAVGNVVGK